MAGPSDAEEGTSGLTGDPRSQYGSSGSMYIGVPDDWQPRTRGRMTGDPRSQYGPGLPNPDANLYKPDDVLKAAPTGSSGRWALQQQMVMVGLLDPEDFTPGIWDAESRNAFEELLGIANTMGVSYQTALTRMAEAGGVGGAVPDESGGGGAAGGEAGPPPLVLNPSDPETLKAIVDRAAMDIYGRGLTDEEASKIVNTYLAFEEATQRETHAVNTSGEGGTLPTMPDVDVFMQTALEKQNPEEATAKKGADAIMEVVNFARTGQFT